mmetsp:Transcript_17519/g.48023  ORF Transcript_17519/g.48023 Transcript_17519/m.48023 type:complete len:200 (+) Transcript_17519:1658-2257(+)
MEGVPLSLRERLFRLLLPHGQERLGQRRGGPPEVEVAGLVHVGAAVHVQRGGLLYEVDAGEADAVVRDMALQEAAQGQHGPGAARETCGPTALSNRRAGEVRHDRRSRGSRGYDNFNDVVGLRALVRGRGPAGGTFLFLRLHRAVASFRRAPRGLGQAYVPSESEGHWNLAERRGFLDEHRGRLLGLPLRGLRGGFPRL